MKLLETRYNINNSYYKEVETNKDFNGELLIKNNDTYLVYNKGFIYPLVHFNNKNTLTCKLFECNINKIKSNYIICTNDNNYNVKVNYITTMDDGDLYESSTMYFLIKNNKVINSVKRHCHFI